MLLRKIQPILSWTLVTKKRIQLFSNTSLNQKIIMKSFQEGNAELAYGVINLIKNKATLQEIQEYSLNQRILNFIQSQPNIRDESKKQISQLFSSGVDIDNDKQVFTQGRITHGLTKIKKKQVFIFYPTYLVTSQIFKNIMNLKDKKVIVTGHKEISKTVSVFLFWKLTQYIDKFRFNSQSEISEKYLQIPKIFYWTIQLSDTLKTVKQKLLKQTDSQYLKKNKDKLKNIKNYYKQYHKQKFSKEPSVIMVCDQSDWIDEHTKIVQCISKKQIKSQQQKFKLRVAKQFLRRMKKIFQKILFEFEGILYLSPTLIDDQVAKSFNYSTEYSHSEVKNWFVLYSSEIYKDQNMYDLCDYFIKQFEQTVLGQNNLFLTESIIKVIRKKCFDNLKDALEMYFFTARGLRKLIQKRKDLYFRQLQNLNTQQQKINYITYQFSNLVNQQTQQYGNMLNQNFLKNDSNDQYRLDIHFKLYSYLTKNDRNSKKQQQPNVQMIYVEEQRGFSSESLNKYLDKRLFYYQLNGTQIKLQLPITLTLKILEKKIADHVKLYLQKHSKIFQYVHDKAQMGKIVQRFFFYALLTGKTDFQFILPSKNLVSFQNISSTQFWFQSLPIFNRPNKDQKNNQQISKQNQIKIQKTSEIEDNLEKKQISNNFSQQLKQQTKNDKEKKINKNVGQLSQEQKNNFIQLSLKKKLKQLQEDTQIRRGNQYQFLKSFEQKIKEIYKTNQSISLLCLPANLKSKQIPKRTSLFLKQKLDKINKCVDGVLLNYIKSNEEPQVQLWAFDLTVGEERVKKLKKFIKQFIGFKDRAVKYIKVGSQNETTKKFKIFLNYYAIDYKESKQDLQSQLNQQFGEFIEFKKNPYCSEYEVVSLKGSDQCLLRRVGFLNYHENIKFINPTQNNALVFQQALQACQRLDSRNAKEKRN